MTTPFGLSVCASAKNLSHKKVIANKKAQPNGRAFNISYCCSFSLETETYLLCKLISLFTLTAIAIAEATTAKIITVTIIFYLSFYLKLIMCARWHCVSIEDDAKVLPFWITDKKKGGNLAEIRLLLTSIKISFARKSCNCHYGNLLYIKS